MTRLEQRIDALFKEANRLGILVRLRLVYPKPAKKKRAKKKAAR